MRLAALMDPDLAQARAWSRLSGNVPCYTEYAEMLGSRELDAVLVASPTPLRFEQAAEALRQGLHTLVETPITPDLREARLLNRLASEAGLQVAPALVRRFEPAYAELRRRILAGELGGEPQLRCQWSAPTQWGERRDSYRSWAGVFAALAWHSADLCRWIFGEIHSVSADIDPLDEPSRDAAANLIVQHEAGLAIHHFRRTDRSHVTEQFLASGTEGTLRLTRLDRGSPEEPAAYRLTAKLAAGDEADVPLKGGANASADARTVMLSAFADRIRGCESPMPDGADLVACAEAVYAAEISSAERNKISLPLGDTAAIRDPVESTEI